MLRNGMMGVLLMALSFPALAVANVAPDALVKQTTEIIIQKIKADRQQIQNDPERLFRLVDEVVLPHFDFEKMSKWVLGKYWRKADQAQRQQFVYEFRQLLVRTYAKALLENVDQPVDFLPLRAKADAVDVTVSTEIPQDGGFPIPINYKMHLNDDGWKVYDVNIDGISLVTNYRTSFSSEIRKNGIDGLLAKLSSRSSSP
ncbi:MAG: ABC transporter substrate-binding protein [Gammaproteobacteria bacterium]|nr:ABC transporter substrate-binding protein [Gammaproteobacteria bacterium]MCF6229342.1 ABC transporter substrate-binding protein [Gammaproteobacteria bacterium]